MKFLLLFLISFSAFAGYMTKEDFENCNKLNRKIHLRKSSCIGDCHKISKDYICETFSLQDVEIDDLSKPKFSKNNIEPCAGIDDCKSKIPSKLCADQEIALIQADYAATYCSKRIGYHKKWVKKYREDMVKKMIYDNTKNQKEKEIKQLEKDILSFKNKLESQELTISEINEVLKIVLKKVK